MAWNGAPSFTGCLKFSNKMMLGARRIFLPVASGGAGMRLMMPQPKRNWRALREGGGVAEKSKLYLKLWVRVEPRIGSKG